MHAEEQEENSREQVPKWAEDLARAFGNGPFEGHADQESARRGGDLPPLGDAQFDQDQRDISVNHNGTIIEYLPAMITELLLMTLL